MTEKILVPVLGESITEATVSKWLKNEGDLVDVDEPIVELETDKVNLEVPSPISGVLTKIDSKDGSTVEVGATLGSISKNGNNLKNTEDTKVLEEASDENKVVKLDIDKEKEKKEPQIFDDKEEELKPLILTQEIEEKKETSNKNNQELSPAVRKIVS